jgi:hypothetical protein
VSQVGGASNSGEGLGMGYIGEVRVRQLRLYFLLQLVQPHLARLGYLIEFFQLHDQCRGRLGRFVPPPLLVHQECALAGTGSPFISILGALIHVSQVREQLHGHRLAEVLHYVFGPVTLDLVHNYLSGFVN